MTEYEVVTSRTIGGLQDRVRELMRMGLRPLGGIAMLHEEDAGQDGLHIVFAQALAREEQAGSEQAQRSNGEPSRVY